MTGGQSCFGLSLTRTPSRSFLLGYVSDSVLANYEGLADFHVHPESGGVHYGNQWSTGSTHRVGRDVIAVELKELYEGTPPSVVRLWHRHAVPPPMGDLQTFSRMPNVATRTRRIAYAIVTIGESLSALGAHLLGEALTSLETVSLSRETMDYSGWWTLPAIERVSRHVPMNLSKDDFLSRCEWLDQLVVEGFREDNLRRILIRLGIQEEEISDHKTLQILTRLLTLASLANSAGLRLITDRAVLKSRLGNSVSPDCLESLFILRELRNARSHRGEVSSNKRLRKALDFLRIDKTAVASSWGRVSDALYDAVAAELERAADILRGALQGENIASR